MIWDRRHTPGGVQPACRGLGHLSTPKLYVDAGLAASPYVGRTMFDPGQPLGSEWLA